MKITSLAPNVSNRSANEEALLMCQRALELKDRGNYESAQRIMRPLWSGLGERPNVTGLYPSVAAELLLTVGVLTCWIGNRLQLNETQEAAKNLITESITYYESTGDVKKMSAARSELGYCYWWRGELDEARILFVEALQKLTAEGNTRARAVLGLAIVEWSATRCDEALKILNEHAYLFKKIPSHAIRASYHNQRAVVLRNLSCKETGDNYIQQAIAEYKEADSQSKLAHNIDFRADLKNNLGLLLCKLSKFKEAHSYLTEARRLSVSVRDKVRTAQFDDTRAQVFIAEKKYKEAEAVARNAVRVLEKSGHQCLLTDALITQGIALARLKQTDHAQFIFQKAIEVACQVGALNKAGLAALTMIEELDELPTETLNAAYERASEWLPKPQSPDLWLRVNKAALKVFAKLQRELKGEHAEVKSEPVAVEETTPEDPTAALLNKACHLPTEVLKFEGSLIRQALAKANGSLTRAAALLSMSYQALAYILESRHKELLKERSPIRRRSRRETADEGSLKT
jgi:tetratricopeptide (TPR) repeat protein